MGAIVGFGHINPRLSLVSPHPSSTLQLTDLTWDSEALQLCQLHITIDQSYHLPNPNKLIIASKMRYTLLTLAALASVITSAPAPQSSYAPPSTLAPPTNPTPATKSTPTKPGTSPSTPAKTATPPSAPAVSAAGTTPYRGPPPQPPNACRSPPMPGTRRTRRAPFSRCRAKCGIMRITSLGSGD